MTEHTNPAAPVVDGDPKDDSTPSPSAWSAWSHDELLVIVERQAAEVQRLTKLAEANGGQARFWADHFAEIETANREALGAHHKPGHTVAELITVLVQELTDLRASREAWAIEADRLDVIAEAAAEQQQTRPDPLVARTWLAKELHNAGACEPGGVVDGQVVCDENCKNLARMAQDVSLGGPIDWTKEES